MPTYQVYGHHCLRRAVPVLDAPDDEHDERHCLEEEPRGHLAAELGGGGHRGLAVRANRLVP